MVVVWHSETAQRRINGILVGHTCLSHSFPSERHGLVTGLRSQPMSRHSRVIIRLHKVMVPGGRLQTSLKVPFSGGDVMYHVDELLIQIRKVFFHL